MESLYRIFGKPSTKSIEISTQGEVGIAKVNIICEDVTWNFLCGTEYIGCKTSQHLS